MSGDHPDLSRLLGPDRRRMPLPRGLGAVVTVIAVLLAIGLAITWPVEQADIDLTTFGFADQTVAATVWRVDQGPCSYSADLDCRVATFEIVDESSSDFGLLVEFEMPDQPDQPDFEPGDGVFLYVVPGGEEGVSYQYADRDRRALLGVLTLVFAIAVVVLGRWRGVAAVAGLGISLAILLFYMLPAIIAGTDAMVVALAGGGAIALVSLYLAHGYNPLTHVATIGAFGALALTALLAWIVVGAARFSGLVTEEAFYLLAIPDLDLNGLLLAGIVLGAIGALDDVTVTQASAVWEVAKASPAMGHGDLYAAGLRVGRDHIVSTVNTLLLAYAGASLPLLILFVLSAQSVGVVASSEVVALEIVRTLVGSIGLVAAVPFTTWLAARTAQRALRRGDSHSP